MQRWPRAVATTAPPGLLALPFALLWARAWAWRGWGTAGLRLPWWAGLLLSPVLDTRLQRHQPSVGDPAACSGGLTQGASPPLSALPQSAAGHGWTPGLLGVAGPGPGKRCCLFFGGRRPGVLGLRPGRLWREQRPLVAEVRWLGLEASS